MKTVTAACRELAEHEERGSGPTKRIRITREPVKDMMPLKLRKFNKRKIAHDNVIGLMKVEGAMNPYVLVLKAKSEQQRLHFNRVLKQFSGSKENFYVTSFHPGSQFDVIARDPGHMQELVEKLLGKHRSKVIK